MDVAAEFGVVLRYYSRLCKVNCNRCCIRQGCMLSPQIHCCDSAHEQILAQAGLPRYIAIYDISRYFIFIAIRDISRYFFIISRYKCARE